MQFKKSNFKIIFVSAVLILAACTKQKVKIEKNYTPNNIPHLNVKSASWHANKDGLSILVKKYSEDDCKNYLTVNTVNCGYQPIQITVANLTDDTFYLNPTGFGLHLAHPKKVAKACHWANYTISSYAGAAAAIFYWPALATVGSTSYLMHKRNRVITKNLINKETLYNDENIKVRPLETLSRIIFVANEDYYPRFNLNIFNKSEKRFLEFEASL